VKDNPAQVNLAGVAASYDEIATFVKTMRNDKYFDNVVISSVANAPGAPAATRAAGTGAESMQQNFNIVLYIKH